MRVAIVQETLRHYRVPFFEALRERLAHDGIDLELYVGQPPLTELTKQDTAEIAWARRSTNHRLGMGSRSLVWQSCLRDLRGADLVIVEQASRMLLNYVLLAWRRVGGPRVAFWGHGRNLASAEASRHRRSDQAVGVHRCGLVVRLQRPQREDRGADGVPEVADHLGHEREGHERADGVATRLHTGGDRRCRCRGWPAGEERGCLRGLALSGASGSTCWSPPRSGSVKPSAISSCSSSERAARPTMSVPKRRARTLGSDTWARSVASIWRASSPRAR